MTTKRRNQHAFLYRITGIDGKDHIHKHWCRVLNATVGITLVVTEEHVQRSIKLGGVGNPATCTMAVSCATNAHLFPHPYLGMIDWWASRCYVLSKVDKNGLPSECHVYSHTDSIADMNDFADMMDNAAGQKKLLKHIQKNGPITVRLEPITPPTEEQRKEQKERRLEQTAERCVQTVFVNPQRSEAKPAEASGMAPPPKKKRTRKTLGGYGAQRRFVVVQTSMLGVRPPAVEKKKKAA